MNEAEWLAATDPNRMVRFLRGRVSDRRAAVFGCACQRGWSDAVPGDEGARRRADVVERYADGLATDAELLEQFGPAFGQPGRDAAPKDAWGWAIALAMLGNSLNDPVLGRRVAVLRDVAGNPFRTVDFSPEWRTSTAAAVARGMYESRDFSAMPILADALQDAGCEDAEVLDHCRGPGPHVRGCWVVDLVLGKT